MTTSEVGLFKLGANTFSDSLDIFARDCLRVSLLHNQTFTFGNNDAELLSNRRYPLLSFSSSLFHYRPQRSPTNCSS